MYSYYPVNYWSSGPGHIPVCHSADDGFGNLIEVPYAVKMFNYLKYLNLRHQFISER